MDQIYPYDFHCVSKPFFGHFKHKHRIPNSRGSAVFATSNGSNNTVKHASEKLATTTNFGNQAWFLSSLLEKTTSR